MLTAPSDAAQNQVSSVIDDLLKLITAIVWPSTIALILLVYRKRIEELFSALTNLAKNADEIKIWQVEVKRDIAKVLDTTAESATNQSSPPLGVSQPEVNAALKVATLVSESPSQTAKKQVLNSVFEQMLSLARDYEATRANMKPGAERTVAMNAIVAKMRALGPTAKEFLPVLTSNRESPGTRLAGIAVLQMSPDESYLEWLAERMGVEQPFVLFHAALALLAAVRFYGSSRRTTLSTALNRSLSTLRSFSGTPDENTFQTLETAKAELGRGT